MTRWRLAGVGGITVQAEVALNSGTLDTYRKRAPVMVMNRSTAAGHVVARGRSAISGYLHGVGARLTDHGAWNDAGVRWTR
ncbi:hypothetical protein KCP73_15875 [Salmonella enterica subsp. enterica]|nr:hypothetical protein KCP73_15875 [Salmonella enterica subsp. enterica]